MRYVPCTSLELNKVVKRQYVHTGTGKVDHELVPWRLSKIY